MGVDFHNHLMPAVDDGAQTRGEALAALKGFKQCGVTSIITTPHFDGSVTIRPEERNDRLEELDTAFEVLKACGAELGDMRIERGVELLLDVPEPDLSDPRLRLAGGSFFLMEFPHMTVPPHSARAVAALTRTGFTPIIAHPERYHGFSSTLDLADQWRQAGAFLQLNGSSLVGRYGENARKAAFELLRRGWIDYICSDYHARGPLGVAEYRALLESNGAAEQAHTLMQTNPARVLSGQPPIPVGPIQFKSTLWGRVKAVFGS